jgi:hypothetical protein
MAGSLTGYGVLYFAGVKLAGYSAAGFLINRRAHAAKPNPLVFGATRTVVGIAAGLVFPFVSESYDLNISPFAIYAMLAPLRLCEWLVLLWLFYTRRSVKLPWARFSLYGTGWSYVLDLPALLSIMFVPGGWID